MSTKTTFKRVAAVAAAALAIAGFSAVSSSAATYTLNQNLYCYTADGLATGDNTTTTVNNAACNGVAGTYNYVTLKFTAAAAGDVLAVTGSTFRSVDTARATLSTDKLSAVAIDTTYGYVTVATPVTGTITVNWYKNTSGVVSSTAKETVTITVNAAAVTGVYNAAKSFAYIAATDTTTISSTTDAVAVVSSKSASTSAPIAVIKVADLDSLGGGVADTVTATVSGPGTIKALGTTYTAAGSGGASALNYSSTQLTVAGANADATAPTNGVAFFGVFANGQAGIATITLKNSLGTVLGTKTVTFSDTTVSSITATVATKYIAVSTTPSAATNTAGTYAAKFLLKDASGYPVSDATGGAVTVTSADTTKVSSSASYCSTPYSTGYVYCNFATGSVEGPVDVTISTGSTAAGTKVTAVVSLVVSSASAATFTITADSSVAAGTQITYTVTAADAKGYPLPDGTSVTDYLNATTPSAVTGGAAVDAASGNKLTALFTGVTFLNGTATDTIQAPFGTATIATTFTLEGTLATADTKLTAALAGTAPVVTTTVTGDPAVQAATDAAQEATDAANAAYDAANNAMDSADAATAAAQDASDNASAALAAVTSLSATVAKLVKSVAAIAAALAKVQKKIGA